MAARGIALIWPRSVRRGRRSCVKLRPRFALTLIILISAALRIAWGLHLPVDTASFQSLPDQQEYLQLGTNFLHGEGLQFTDGRFGQKVWAYRTPGYPFLIAACGGDITVIRIVQGLLDTFTVLAVYLLARRWISPEAALLASLIAGVNPLLIYFCGLILSETVFTAMLAWGLVLLSSAGVYPFVGSLILALSVLVRPSAIVLPAILAIAAKGKRSLPPATATACLTFGVLLPWAMRNHAEVHAWVFTTTNSGITRYDGFNPDATGASDQSFLRNMPQLSQMDELARSQYLNGLADDFIRKHPGRCAELALIKIARLWSPIPLSTQYSRRLYIAMGLIYTFPLLALASAGLFCRTLPLTAKSILLSCIVYFTLIHAASVSSLRYRLPLEPLLAISAATALVSTVKLRGWFSGKSF